MALLPYYAPTHRFECGVDEAGRGCLAGDVFAAAVILPPDFFDPMLNDSKQLSLSKRLRLRKLIEQEAVAWAIGRADAREIDEINILSASILAMNRAIEGLPIIPDFLLIDGNRFHTTLDIAYQTIVSGDATYASIAAASILAKTYRDDYMQEMALRYPAYDWASNKGYPTAKHREAIRQHGATPLHRKSFTLVK